MSRRYSADNSESRFTCNAATDLTGNLFMFGIIRRRAVGAGWQCIVAHHDSGGTARCGLSWHDDKLEWSDGANVSATTATFTSTTNWLAVAVSKATGSTVPTFYVKDLTAGSAAASHAGSGSGIGNPTSCNGGTIRFGEWQDGDDLNANLAVTAGGQHTITLAQFDAMVDGLATSDVWSGGPANPKYLYEWNQNPVSAPPDLAGNGATHTVTNATTADTGTDPPGWTYDGTGSGTQTITPGHVASTAQLFAPTFTPGAVTVTPGHLASTAQIFAPTLAPSFTLTPARVDAAPSVFTPTLNPGAVTVAPAHVASGAQVFAPTVGSGITVTPGFVASGAQTFSPTFAVGAITVTPAHLASGALVFAPSFTGGEEPGTPDTLRVPTIPTVPTVPTMNR